MRITMRFQFLILLTFLFVAGRAAAQTGCLDFEDFPQGPVFGPLLGNSPGDTVFSQDGLQVAVQEIQYANGNTGFSNGQIQGSNINWLDGQFLFMGNNAIELHYTGGVQTVCFEFFDGGGEENVSVNGSPVAVLQQFTEVENLAIPGVEIELTLDSTSAGGLLSIGTVCFSGEIESLLIGGQEFGVDNVCASEAEGSGGDCIEFEGMQTPGYGDGNTMPGAVFYEESGVNLRLAPFQTLFWTSTFGFLNVLEQPGFAAASGQYVQFDNINAIFDFTQYPETVEEVAVDFQYDPAGDGSVNFAANGAPFVIQFNLMPGFYTLAPGVELEVTYTNNSMTEGELLFTGNIQSLLIGGANGLSIDNVCVNPPPPCPIDNFALEVGECNPNGVFDLTIDFDYAGLPSDTVVLLVNGDEQLYVAGDFPVVFSPFVAIPDTLVFELSLPGVEGCSVTEELYPPFCDDEPCPPGTFEAIVGECEANGSFPVTFEYTGDADTVQLSNSVSNNPVFVPGDIVNELENSYNVDSQLNVIIFELQELGGNNCSYVDTVAVPYCESCLLTATLESEPVCSATGQYTVGINVYGADNGDTLTVTSSETGTVQNIPFSGNPVTLTLPVPADNFDEITICPYDAPSPDCCIILSYDLPCEGGCGLGEAFLATDTVSCNEDGTYDAALFVENLNAGEEVIATSLSTGFSENLITGVTGVEYLQMTGWPVPEYGADSLEICLVDQPNCCTYTAFGVDCPPVECNFEAEVSLLSCDPGGVMTFEVTTSSDDPAVGQYVNVIVGDIQYGLVAMNTTVEVGLLINEGEDEVDVVIENWSGFFSGPICSIVETVDVSSCVSDCAGPLVEAIPEACSSSNPGAYELHLEIFPDTNANPVYDFYANGDVVIQQVFLPNGSTTLEILPYNSGTSPDVITVCYHQEPECCTSIYIDPLQCDCDDIESMTATMLPCEESGEYFVEIDLDFIDNFGYPFNLEVDGEYFDTYVPEDLPIIVGPFAGNGEPHEFYAQGDGECEGAGATVDGQFCDSDCPITGIEVVTEPGCANTSGSFYYGAFELLGVNAPGDSVIVTSQVTGETTLGVLDPNGSGVFDFNLPNTNLGYDVVTVCLFNQPNCCFEIDYDINCPSCEIQEWVVEPQECEADGTFSLFVDVVFEGAPTGIEVIIPGLNYSDVFDSGAFPLELPGFVGDGDSYDVFLIPGCDNEIVTEVEFPNCINGGGCLFENVIVEPHPCEDGEFFVDVEVQVNEPGILGYYVFGDGEIFGPFSYDEPFVTVGPFAGDGETVYDFLILDIENPACFGYAEFGPKDCDDSNCGILSMTAEPQECNGDGTYDLFLDIEMEDPNEDPLFWFYLNGALIGQSTLAPLPVELINVPLTDTENVVFKACIFDQPNCCIEVEYPQPDCLNDNCPIDNVTVDFAFCDTTGFYVELDFDGPVPNTAGSYRIFGNGETYDTLGYDAPRPVIVGPFDPYTDNIYELIVADLQQPNCSDFVEFPAFDCEEGQEVCIGFSDFDGFTDVSNDSDGYIGEVDGVDISYSKIADDAEKEVSVLDNPFDGFTLADSSVLYTDNAGVSFDAGPLPDPVDSRRFSFDYYLEDTVETVVVGADNMFFYRDIPMEDSTILVTPDISITFELVNDKMGTITVEGPIRKLLFGPFSAEALAIDNVCVTHVPEQVCAIENVEVDALSCDEDGKYKLFL
ncbi:MAG: hypothetical protein GVY26_09780, partial [Bacteroidetes bacterium]|nr:hypothetical protein [Bacteroidota bacterium]